MENLGLVRKIAWSFSTSTGLDFDDLFQEASLAYLEAMENYDESKGKISTYVWICIHNHLKDYLKEEQKFMDVLSIDEIETQPTYDSSLFWERLSNDALEIAKVVLESPHIFERPIKEKERYISKIFSLKDKSRAKKKIKEIMYRKGWSFTKYKLCMEELSIAFS